MRLSFAFAIFVSSATGFAPVPPRTRWSSAVVSPTFRSTMEAEETTVAEVDTVEVSLSHVLEDEVVPLSESEINARLSRQIAKLQAKDATSMQLSKEVSVRFPNSVSVDS